MAEKWTLKRDDHGLHIRPEGNGDCVAHTTSLPQAEQIVREHNAIDFAVECGANWNLNDWRNWLRYHAQKEVS